jgi:OmpA-OmpF porin, OOP family
MNNRRFAPIFLLVVLGSISLVSADNDFEGSRDHPLITRMPGFYISDFEVEEFGAYEPTVIGGAAVLWEGKKHTIRYRLRDNATPVSMLQISRNYASAVKSAGGVVLGADERRVAAEIRKGGALTGVYVEAFNEGRLYWLVIVEVEEMRQDVTADATIMGSELKSAGRTIIHGIYFDTGSSVIKPESEAAVVEMVKLLNLNPSLKAYVVGHTDNVGALEVNLKLSADRAEAVTRSLVTRGIPAPRIRAAGVGPYSPVASNDDDQGRSLNRRVELVAQ